MIKKIIILSLSILLVFSNFSFADKMINEKADVLVQLSLLRGNGNSLDLDSKLSRAEGSAFIVRIMGMENKVLSNKSKYITSVFPDVKSEDWYAPYVGYCVKEGIINGYPDGTFKPNEFLSEKAFLKMVLKALGYTDFTWETVNTAAYDVGLVKDISYAVKVDDNLDYKRSMVVDTLYNSLKININSSYKTVVNRLIDNNIISEIKANSLGVLKIDDLKTDIKELNILSNVEVSIKFNENISKINKSDVLIYEKNNKENKLEIKEIILKDDNLNITTSPQVEGVDYIIEINNIVDSDNNIVEILSKNFSGYTIPEIKSDYFKISKVESISKSQINVYFTHPINISAELPLFYSIYDDNGNEYIDGTFKNLVAKVAGEKNNMLSIRLKNKFFENDVKYTLKIKGDLSSIYGVKLNEGDGENFEFIGNSSENPKLKIVSVKPIKSNYVRVIFDRDIDTASALDMDNYKLKDTKNNITYQRAFDAKLTGTDELKYRQVDIKWLTFVKNREYQMTIDGVKDSFEFSTINDEVHPFIYALDEEDTVKLQYIGAANNRKLLVFFDRPIDSSSVNLSITGISKKKVLYNPEKPYMLTIYLASAISSNETEVTIIAGVKDKLGVSQSGNLSYKVKGTSESFGDINIVDARFISKDSVKLEFSEEIYSSTSYSQFKLYYIDSDGDKQYINAKGLSIINNNIAVVKFSDVSTSRDYKIEATNLKDYSNQFTTSSTTKSVIRE